MLREAEERDIPAIQHVRASVRENRLVSTVISDDDVRRAIEATGRGWVVENEGAVIAFAIGNSTDGNVWALFVHPDHERRGHGRRLHDVLVAWLWSRGLERLWLTTAPGTRAEKFYAAAGWVRAGTTSRGEVRFELERPARK
jgi:GNAT superfamily N-acetyltransferase